MRGKDKQEQGTRQRGNKVQEGRGQ